MSQEFKIRKAIVSDVKNLSALHVATFNETHGTGPNAPSYHLRETQWSQIFQNQKNDWFCLVIENNQHQLVGFARGIPYQHSDLPDYGGELNKIYILKEFQKKGLGKELISAVASEFIKRNIVSMVLFGDAKNPSNGFYERMGGERIMAPNGEFHGGYGWKNLNKLTDICADNFSFKMIKAELNHLEAMKNLMQLYIYDFTEYVDNDVDENGLYKPYPDLEEYCKQGTDKHAYLITKNNNLIGFVMIKKTGAFNEYYSIAEFFIMKKYRRTGVGRAVAKQIFDFYRGAWEIHQRENNVAAQEFWNKVIVEYTSGHFRDKFENGRRIQHFNN